MKNPPKVVLAVLGLLLWACSVFAVPTGIPSGLPPGLLIAPPEPPVRPEIVHPVDADKDINGVDDRLEFRIKNARAAVAAARNPVQAAYLERSLDEQVQVELVFSHQVTQKQINDFVSLGGQIDHIYTNVSYGWNAAIPLRLAESLKQRMGPTLMAVVADSTAILYMDEATRCGRVRPAWAAGFGGSAQGFSGNSNTTIAIIDTGVDDEHFDLAGRQLFWDDYSSDNEPTPRDVKGHGTHVAGIACGAGAAGGTGTQLLYTDSNDLTGVPGGSYIPSPIHLPAGSRTLSSTATWIGGGSLTLYGLSGANGSSGLGQLSSPTSGLSPISESNTFTAGASNHYSAGLTQNAAQPATKYVILNTVSYAPVGDGFNTFRGVAPGCNWANAKVFVNSTGLASTSAIRNAIDDLVARRVTDNIKIMNMSFGAEIGTDTLMRSKVNTAVNNGIVAVAAAGNSGRTGIEVADPGRAGLAITVGASNDINQLTDYTSVGFSDPTSSEDNKPDVMAPGGSTFYSSIMAPDTNDADTSAFADQRADDYANLQGTSMAAPFVAGAAALIIQAMEQNGVTWSFASNTHSLLVKMLLCATSTESNNTREPGGSGGNPTLGRAAAPKDIYEGYGMINVDAAIDAVTTTFTSGTDTGSTNGGAFDRRAWGRKLSVTNGVAVNLVLDVPATGDFDLYVYSASPNSKGNPVIVASSAGAGNGVDESVSYTPSSTTTQYLVVKRVTGSGTWTLLGSTVADASPPGPPAVTDDGAYTSSTSQIHASWSASDAQSGVVEYQYAISSTKLESGIISGGGWTSVGFQTSQTRSGLTLTRGQAYYTLVKAKNGGGAWSAVGVADGIVPVQYSPLIAGGAKAKADAATVGLPAQTVTAKFSDHFYVEDATRTTGIRVHPIDMPATLAVGQTVDIGGTLQTVGSERRIASACATITVASGTARPVNLPGRHVTGKDWLYNSGTGAGQKGSAISSGLNNIGLLIRAAGKVTQIGSGYLYIDDGSGVVDGTQTSSTPNKGIRIICNPAGFVSGNYVYATGISSFFLSGPNLLPAIQTRTQPADLVKVKN